MSTKPRAALVLVAALAGCRAPTCAERVAQRDDAGAAIACAAAFAHGGAPDDGLAAANAYRALHRDDDALALAARLVAGARGNDARRLMARIHVDRDQRGLAVPLMEHALALDQARGDHAAAYADAAILVTASWTDGELGAALRIALVACAEAAAAGDPALHATSLIALGGVYHAAGASERALEAYAQATAELAPGDRLGRARVLLARGALLGEQRQRALARPLFEEARTLAAGLGAADLALAAEVNLADLALGRGELEAADRHLDAAQQAWRAGGSARPSQGILVNRAMLERRRGRFAEASRALDAASAADPPPDTAWVLAHERGQLAAAQHDGAGAERSYLAAIAIIEELWRSAAPETLQAPYLEDRWLPYQSLFALRAERGDAGAAFAAVIAAQGRMFLAATIAASADRGAAIDRPRRLRALAPTLAASPLARSYDAASTLAALDGRYVLDYFPGGGAMRLLVIDHGRVRVTGVNVELAALDKLVDDFLARADDRAAAQALGDALLPPDVQAALPRRFHVIPDGALQRVPFAALVAGTSRLVDHHDIVYAPSATGLAGLAAAVAAPATPAIVLGDAGNLVHGGEETAAVIAATRATARTGGAATLTALRAARDASLLHVVGHSGVGVDGGYLVLADGEVSAAEILTSRVRPHLVVLATCASAASRRRDMWGSLATAFLAAGSTDVVATMFSIEDRIAAEFTARFYRHGGARDPVAATASAQRELATRYPTAAWSAFMVVGL